MTKTQIQRFAALVVKLQGRAKRNGEQADRHAADGNKDFEQAARQRSEAYAEIADDIIDIARGK